VSQQMESDLYDYYGWDPVWGNSYFGPGALASAPYYTDTMLCEPPGLSLRLNDGDPHLPSIAVVKGYHVHATDGEIGHVENLLLDDANWHINYLIIDTKNWWFGHTCSSRHLPCVKSAGRKKRSGSISRAIG